MIRLNAYRLMHIALLAVLLAACGSADTTDGPEANVTYVVVTAAPVPPDAQVAAATAAPTRAPAPVVSVPSTATPEIPPTVTLQIADRYLLDGYFEDAVYAYQILVDAGDAVSADVRASAAYGMAQAALREGLFEQAVQATSLLISQFPQDFRAVQAYFLRGDAYMGLSRWENAIADYQQYLLLRPGIIDSYAYERIGDAQLNLDQFDVALVSYDQATAATRSNVPQAALMEKVARLYRLSGDVDQAVAQYDGILEFAQNTPYRAGIELEAGLALLEAGDLPRALIRLQRVFDEYEGTGAAYEAMQLLLENGQTLDPYRMGRVYFANGVYEAAIEAFDAYTTATPLTEIPAGFYIQLGQAYRAVGNFDAARVAFQAVIDQYPNDPLFGDALLEQGRTFFQEGDIEGAITRYSQIADTYTYLSETAAEALWRVGYLYATNDDPAQARTTFLRLADAYPQSEWTVSGLNIAASAAVTEEENAVAETLYARLATLTTGTDQADAYLQLGRLALLRGDPAAADQAFALAEAAAPASYYSARAEDIRAGRAPFDPPDQTVFTFDDAAEVAAAEAWLRDTFGIAQEGPLWPLSITLEQDARIVRGRELWAVGAFDAAYTEFLDVIAEYATDPLASYQLAIYMRIIGAYRPSIVAAANLIIRSGWSTLDVPPYIARMRYPAYYGDEVRKAAAQYGFDPLVLLALIRHESLFDTHATAAAGEKGLTQVIPPTGDYIAEQLNWPDYQHRDLFRPYAGVAFGAYYLAEQLERFEGNTYAALAGYNAGPGRAIGWLDISGGDPDRFMAAISISSTQLYVQRIYSHYNVYRALYGVDRE